MRVTCVWEVVAHPEASTELGQLPPRERAAMLHAIEKLQALGPLLPFPHQRDVRGAEDVRELRPRAGRSPWRGFYRRMGATFAIAAVGSEAKVDPCTASNELCVQP
jgi:hypothetical protein